MEIGKYKKRLFLFFFIALLIKPLFPERNSGFTIIAGKDTNPDHAVLLAHNEDDEGKNNYVNVYKIPPKDYRNLKKSSGKPQFVYMDVQKAFGFLLIEVPDAEYGDTYINENGVVITSNRCDSREDKHALTNNSIGTMLRKIMSEQATSARHAVDIAGQLIQQYGYYESGRTYAIADANEGWILHVVKGKHWVAQRVPDDQVVVVSNRYIIERVNLYDKKNFMGSPDIVFYADKRSWYNPKKEGAFNFAKAYSDPEAYNDKFNILRQWRGVSLLSKTKYNPDSPLPFSFYPKKNIKEIDLFAILRDHYEGTQFDATSGKDECPNNFKFKTICNEFTQYSFVAVLRNDLPSEYAHCLWLSFNHPDSNAFSPWYLSITNPPEGYSIGIPDTSSKNPHPRLTVNSNPDIAFPYYARLSQLIDQSYRWRIKKARKEWENFENYALKMQGKIEKEFDYLVKKNKIIALKHITNYVEKMEYRRWFLASELIGDIGKK